MAHRVLRQASRACLLVAAASGATRPVAATTAPAAEVPLAFEENIGQFDAGVRFVSRGNGYTLFLTDREAVLTLRERTVAAVGAATPASVIRLSLEQSDARTAAGVERLPGVVNYLIGNDPAKWRTDVPLYERVRYNDVYRGVDLIYYGHSGRHEYDFVVRPGANPASIAMRVTGAGTIDLDGEGDLLLATAAGTVTMKAPVVYQIVDGERRDVDARYVMATGNTVRFDVDEYDAGLPLVIDPQLTYSTFLGGTGNGVDQANGIALDGSGNAYIVGMTETSDFPTESPLQPQRKGSSDAVISKLSPDGQRLVYSTYLGGSSFDSGVSVAVRKDGLVYVIGDTSSDDFPVRDAFQRTYKGATDTFVVALSRSGSAIEKGTYLGGEGTEVSSGLQLSQLEDSTPPPEGTPPEEIVPPSPFGDWVFLYGDTQSREFPTVIPAQNGLKGARDGYVMILARDTLQPVYSSYAGSDGDDRALALVAQPKRGDLYLVLARQGVEDDPTRAVIVGHFGKPAAGVEDRIGDPAKYARLEQKELFKEASDAGDPRQVSFWRNAALKTEFVSLFLGFEVPSIVPLSRVRPAVVTPVQRANAGLAIVATGCLPVPPAQSCTDRATLLLWNQDLAFTTHLTFGGAARGRSFLPTRVAVDKNGLSHIIGTTSDNGLPVQNPIQATYAGSSEGFILTLNPGSGETSFFSYLGGSSFDTLKDIAVDKDGARWIVGETLSADFPTTRSGIQPSQRGRIDGFVVKIEP